MTIEASVAGAAVEGQYYNFDSNLQAACLELAMPRLREAACAILTDGHKPLVIADYGSSLSDRSLRPMQVAIEMLRLRVGPKRTIKVVHTDLPSNDFVSRFVALHDDGANYRVTQPNVLRSGSVRCYSEPILSPGCVHLGWNCWTLDWMSRNPAEVSDHLVSVMSTLESARAAIERQQAEDWKNFLKARSLEMTEGARLVSLLIGRTPDLHGWEWVYGELWHAAKSMGADGLLSPEELIRLTAPLAGRSTGDLKVPFAKGPFLGLFLEHIEVKQAPDPFWKEFRRTRDAQQLGRRWAGLMRAVFGAVAAAALGSRSDSLHLVDVLFRRFESRIANAPQKNVHFIAIAVLRKAK